MLRWRGPGMAADAGIAYRARAVEGKIAKNRSWRGSHASCIEPHGELMKAGWRNVQWRASRSAACSCGKAAKSLHSGCGLRGLRSRQTRKGETQISHFSKKRMDWASAGIIWLEGAVTNGFRVMAREHLNAPPLQHQLLSVASS